MSRTMMSGVYTARSLHVPGHWSLPVRGLCIARFLVTVVCRGGYADLGQVNSRLAAVVNMAAKPPFYL